MKTATQCDADYHTMSNLDITQDDGVVDTELQYPGDNKAVNNV